MDNRNLCIQQYLSAPEQLIDIRLAEIALNSDLAQCVGGRPEHHFNAGHPRSAEWSRSSGRKALFRKP